MKIVTTDRARAYIRSNGGEVWVWLDPHRGLVGSHTWLEAHTAPPGSTRRTRFTRSSRRAHRFRRIEADDVVVYADLGRLDPPDELLLDLRGRLNRCLRAYWNGCVFVDDDREAQARTRSPSGS